MLFDELGGLFSHFLTTYLREGKRVERNGIEELLRIFILLPYL
jgi:hypothetical protein